uniref:Uncharacterized protein n=1 Tax=Pelusios castaneus TaxID=367368 RepID=A0A8C8REV1_9SAUR
MKGSGKALIRHSSRAALPSISTTSFSSCSTRGGPFSLSSLRDLCAPLCVCVRAPFSVCVCV